MAESCDGKMSREQCKGCQFTDPCLMQNISVELLSDNVKTELRNAFERSNNSKGIPYCLNCY